MTPSEGRERGEARRKRGVARGEHGHDLDVLRDRVRLIDALLSDPDGSGTLDDATPDLRARCHDGGRWRGAVTLGLSRAGIIAATGRHLPSSRPSRHACRVAEWRLTDRASASRYRDMLAASIAALESAASTAEPDQDTTTNPPFSGEPNDGQAL